MGYISAMSLTSTLTADLRARSSWMPFCPLCSVIGHTDTPDDLRGPSCRRVVLPKSSIRPEPVTIYKSDRCCGLSATDDHFESPSDLAAWWRHKRQQPLSDPATDNRRKNVLAKLAAKQLEPIE